MTAAKEFDCVGAIIEFENGDLDEEGTLELFQHLIDTGLAWKLQGSYGRMAKALIDRGLCHEAGADSAKEDDHER